MSTQLARKINLPEKGNTAFLANVDQLKATLKWSDATDLDLVAIYVKNDNTCGMISFVDKGNLNLFPFIMSSGDAGVGDKVDTSAGNEESMVITKIDPSIKAIYLLAWDYEAARNSRAARFTKDLKLSILSVSGQESDTFEATLALSDSGHNGVAVSVIEKGTIGYQYKNISKGFTLYDLDPVNILASIGIHAKK
jgi:tellurite resistance protein TerA